MNEEGELFTWGYNRMNLNRIPSEVQGKKVKSIAAGYQVSIVVLEDGSLVTWGNENAVDIVASKAKDENVKLVRTNISTGLALTEDGRLIPLAKRETAFDAVPDEIQGRIQDLDVYKRQVHTQIAVRQEGRIHTLPVYDRDGKGGLFQHEKVIRCV